MSTRITIDHMTEADCTAEFADRLDLDQGDIAYITNEDNGGACYTFAVDGEANAGSVYVDSTYVAIECGGDPQWYMATADAQKDDEIAITLALNGELPDA